MMGPDLTQNTSLSPPAGGEIAPPGHITGHDMAVLEAIVQGKTLEEAGVNSAFLLRVAQSHDLAVTYAKAREMSSYALEEEALGRLRAAATGGKLEHGALRAIDLLAQQLRWSAIKRNPNVYSEKAAVNVTVPIQINTSLDLGDGATSGTKEFPNIYEATVTVEREVPRADLPGDGPAADIRYGGATHESLVAQAGPVPAPVEGSGTEEELAEFQVVAQPKASRVAPAAKAQKRDRVPKKKAKGQSRVGTRAVAEVVEERP